MKKTAFIIVLSFLCAFPLSAKDMLVNVSQEGAGANCTHGGVKIESGTDDDENGSLEDSEVTSTNYVCDGAGPAVSVTEEAAGTNCAAGGVKVTIGSEQPKYVCNGEKGDKGHDAISRTTSFNAGEMTAESGCANGGTKIEVGVDSDDSNELEDTEITQTKYICNGENGGNGHNALLKVSDEPKGDNCTKNDGIKIETGIDLDNSGSLEDSEVDPTQTKYVCNGKNASSQGAPGPKGHDALARTSSFNAGEMEAESGCVNGGIKIEVGVDSDDNGKLEDSEVTQIKYVCNGDQGPKGDEGPAGEQGEQGETGPSGANGSNGAAALVSVVNEPKGENCVAGGKKIETGLDVNGNGTLDEGEVDSENIHYVCNGRDAEEAGLTSSSTGCSASALDDGDSLILALLAALSMIFAFAAVKKVRG